MSQASLNLLCLLSVGKLGGLNSKDLLFFMILCLGWASSGLDRLIRSLWSAGDVAGDG